MSRITDTELRALTQEPVATDCTIAMTTASAVMDGYLADSGMSEALLKAIELYLAGHYLLVSLENGPLAKKSVDFASEGYHDVYKGGLLSTRFGQQAVALDITGALAEMSARADNPNVKPALFGLVDVITDPPTW